MSMSSLVWSSLISSTLASRRNVAARGQIT